MQHLPPPDKFFDRADAKDLAQLVAQGKRCILVQAFPGEVRHVCGAGSCTDGQGF